MNCKLALFDEENTNTWKKQLVTTNLERGLTLRPYTVLGHCEQSLNNTLHRSARGELPNTAKHTNAVFLRSMCQYADHSFALKE